MARYAWLSVAAALTTMALKGAAAAATRSTALASDAVESGVNLVAALVTLVAVRLAERPPDEDHHHGHTKAELFAAGVEGVMVLAAAAAIAVTALPQLWDPRPLRRLDLGVAATLVATAVNLTVALVVLRAGRRHRSMALEADARHLLTDVWTSVGVVVGVVLVGVTGIDLLDPLCALAVAVNIVVAGVGLLRRSSYGLMDGALPDAEHDALEAVLRRCCARHDEDGVAFHELRTRQAGRRSFMSVHLLVPGSWPVQRGHDLVDELHVELRSAVPGLHVTTQLEPLEDPRSYDDSMQPHLPGME